MHFYVRNAYILCFRVFFCPALTRNGHPLFDREAAGLGRSGVGEQTTAPSRLVPIYKVRETRECQPIFLKIFDFRLFGLSGTGDIAFVCLKTFARWATADRAYRSRNLSLWTELLVDQGSGEERPEAAKVAGFRHFGVAIRALRLRSSKFIADRNPGFLDCLVGLAFKCVVSCLYSLGKRVLSTKYF